MSRFFTDMGYIRYPMYIATIFMLVQIVRAAMETRRPPESRRPMTRHTVLIWGVLNALLGVLGTVVGLVVTGNAIERFGTTKVALVAGGIKVALYPTILGLLLLAVAILAWLGLQLWQGISANEGVA
jgi:biopolymer transport protein ExbB/TolQ